MDSLAARADPSPAGAPDRERLLLAMAELCASSRKVREPGVRERIGALFVQVLTGAEPEARRRFAERHAGADWTARALEAHLADDEPAVAQPVIAHGRALTEADLETVLARGSAEHRAAVARRPRLSPRLAEAVVDTHEPLALAALAGNAATDLPIPVLRRLLEHSRRIVALRAPLAWRADLPVDFARRLHSWVGEELRADLSARYDFDASAPAPVAEPASDEPREAERRLVQKLEASGQLKPGYLLRTLREGRLSLFETALSALGGFQQAEVSRALQCHRPELLAFACAAVGIDRSVFPTVLELVQSLNGGLPAALGPAPTGFEGVAMVGDPNAAAQAFRDGVALL